MPDEIKPDASLDEVEESAENAEQAEEQAADSGEDSIGEPDADNPELTNMANEGDISEEEAEQAMQDMLDEEGKGVIDEAGNLVDEFPDLSGVQEEQAQAHPAEFQQLNPLAQNNGTKRNIDLLLDVKMPVSIELGRTVMPIADLLSLGPGSVVELNKLAGEPVELMVNDVAIARGEVVVVEENFGVRITQLMSPEERLKSMAQR